MEAPVASTNSRVTQLEEARDQLLLLLRTSDEHAQKLKAEADASRIEAIAERRRLLARVKRERESIRHQAKLERLGLEHRWQLSESALLAALGSRAESIRRLEEKQAELLERLEEKGQQVDSHQEHNNVLPSSGSAAVDTGGGGDRAAASASQAGLGSEIKVQREERSALAEQNLQLTRALEDAERLRALAEERMRRREDELQERVEELLRQVKDEHNESAAVEAVATLEGAVEKLRAEVLEDRVQELTRELSHAEQCLRGGGIPVPREQGSMSLVSELQERCAVSEAAEARAQRENAKLEAQIEQLEKSLEAAVKERRQRTDRLEDELHVVCTWANSIEQEYERDFALLEQEYVYLEQFVPEEVRKQLKQSNLRGSSSSNLRPPLAPSVSSSGASTPGRSSQKRSPEGLPPPYPLPPGDAKVSRQMRSTDDERPDPEQQQEQQDEQALVRVQSVTDKALQSALSWSSERALSAPATPRCSSVTENQAIQRRSSQTPPPPGRNRTSGDGQIGRLDAMYSTIQNRAKQALTEQLEAVTAQLSKAEATVTEKDAEIHRLKSKLQGSEAPSLRYAGCFGLCVAPEAPAGTPSSSSSTHKASGSGVVTME